MFRKKTCIYCFILAIVLFGSFSIISQNTNGDIFQIEQMIRMIRDKTLKEEPLTFDLCTTEWRNESARKSRNILSYTLFGGWAQAPRVHGLVELLATEASSSRLYHNWTMRLYHDDMLPSKVQQSLLQKHKNLILCDINRIPGYQYGTYGDMFGSEWRFFPFGDQTVDTVCSRDLDTPLTEREFSAVEQWLASGKYFHLMRDHPQHGSPQILAGVFCLSNRVNRTRSNFIYSSLLKFYHKKVNGKNPEKLSDQYFLRQHVWPYIKNDVMQHDAWYCRDSWLKRHGGMTAFTYPREKNTSLFMGCKRPCNTRTLPQCPIHCRPKDHKDWINC